MSALTRRAALGGGVLAAGGLLAGTAGGLGRSGAAPSAAGDADILRGLLVLEQVQERFYREAVAGAGLSGAWLALARAVGGQEADHARLLADRLGGAAPAPGRSDFGEAVRSTPAFRTAAITLEELVLAAYVGQGANLSAGFLGTFATLVSVEARQVAWLRHLAGEPPAPDAADAARPLDDVLADLRDRGWLA